MLFSEVLMGKTVKIITGGLVYSAELNDSSTAQELQSLLPLELAMSRWGDEYYGGCGIDVPQASDAREVMEVGELAVWPAGKALCIFFGPTPASHGSEPRAVSPVNPVGKITGDVKALKSLGRVIRVRIEAG
jgi:hypothetical protein